MFRGQYDAEIWEDYHGERWAPWVSLLLPLLNNHDGYFQHFPFAGGYMEQPGATMAILEAAQASYYEYLAEKMPVRL